MKTLLLISGAVVVLSAISYGNIGMKYAFADADQRAAFAECDAVLSMSDCKVHLTVDATPEWATSPARAQPSRRNVVSDSDNARYLNGALGANQRAYDRGAISWAEKVRLNQEAWDAYDAAAK